MTDDYWIGVVGVCSSHECWYACIGGCGVRSHYNYHIMGIG